MSLGKNTLVFLSCKKQYCYTFLASVPVGSLMCRDQRVCEADRDIFFSILWTGGVYKNWNLWTGGVLKMMIRWTHRAQSLKLWSLGILNNSIWIHAMDRIIWNMLHHIANRRGFFMNPRMVGDTGSGSPASHTRTFPDIVTPPPGRQSLHPSVCLDVTSPGILLVKSVDKYNALKIFLAL